MILIGQYDSSFVRRIAIALTLYRLPFQHRPLSAFSDAAEVTRLNPLGRVPALVLDSGEVLSDSHMILDYLDGQMPEDEALFPPRGDARRKALKIASLATGLGDRMVSLYYERCYHPEPSEVFIDRLNGQIRATLNELEDDLSSRNSLFWSGPRFGHADIAVACVLRHMNEAHPGLVDMTRYPTLAAHATRMEELEVFKTIQQPFFVPKA